MKIQYPIKFTHHAKYFSNTRITIPFQGIILRKAWSSLINQIYSKPLLLWNLVRNNFTSLTLHHNYQQKPHLINFARSPLPQVSVVDTDSLKTPSRRFTKPHHVPQPKSAIFSIHLATVSAASTFAVAMWVTGDQDLLFVRRELQRAVLKMLPTYTKYVKWN